MDGVTLHDIKAQDLNFSVAVPGIGFFEIVFPHEVAGGVDIVG
jgi:hypothetical protein